MSADLLLLLAVPALWGLNALLAWVGVVRHTYRIALAWQDRATLAAQGTNGLLRFAADGAVVGEQYRMLTKLLLLGFALLRFSLTWERLDVLVARWDERDVLAPLTLLALLLLLTHWSNWELCRRPRPGR